MEISEEHSYLIQCKSARAYIFFLPNVFNIAGNFLNRILELFGTVNTVSAPSMSGILKLAVLSTIDNLGRRMLRRVKLVVFYF
jgi:hypothetical protein